MSDKTAKELYREAWRDIRMDMYLPPYERDVDGYFEHHGNFGDAASICWHDRRYKAFDGWPRHWKQERFVRLRNQYWASTPIKKQASDRWEKRGQDERSGIGRTNRRIL